MVTTLALVVVCSVAGFVDDAPSIVVEGGESVAPQIVDDEPSDDGPDETSVRAVGRETTAETAEASSSTSSDPASIDGPPLSRTDPCGSLVEKGEGIAAIRCLRATTPIDDEDRRRIAERIFVLEALERKGGTSSGSHASDANRLTLQSFVLSGRPEVLVGSAMLGAVMGPLAIAHGAFLANSAVGGRWPVQQWQVPGFLVALSSTAVLASPLVGATLGFTGALPLVLPKGPLSDGDADLLRSALVVCGLQLSLFWFSATLWPRPSFEGLIGYPHLPTIQTGAALSSVIATMVAAGAFVGLVDVPDAAGAAGLSAGAYAAVLSLLVLGAIDVPIAPLWAIALVGAASHAAFASTVALSFVYRFHRISTWVVDLGALAGLAISAALVLGVPAGNPVTGYGGMAAGMTAGAISGLLLAELTPAVVDLLPPLDDAVGLPLLLPSLDGRSLGVGMAIASPFESSPTR